MMKAPNTVDYKAISSMLQERQLKILLAHDKSHRVKRQDLLTTR